jgi:hypothetical protein
MKTQYLRLATLWACTLTTASAYAWDALPAKNEATLARSFALPALGQSQIYAPDEQAVQLSVDVINEYYADRNASESITLDGETTKLNLLYRRGLANDLELTVNLPFLIVGGGFMDQFMQDWHRTFGLPNGGRESAPNDRRLYQYTRSGTTQLNVGDNGGGFGDVELGAGWQAYPTLALRGMIKLPTGNQDRLTGGNLGGAAWLDWALPFAQGSSFDGFASGGVSVARRSDVLPSQQQTALAFGGAGLGYHVTDNLQVLGQLYAHTALYKDTDLDGLRKPGLQLTLGGSYRLAPDYQINLYFQEDPIVASSPDFSIHLGLTVK